jgi:hypothetical protein
LRRRKMCSSRENSAKNGEISNWKIRIERDKHSECEPYIPNSITRAKLKEPPRTLINEISYPSKPVSYAKMRSVGDRFGLVKVLDSPLEVAPVEDAAWAK